MYTCKDSMDYQMLKSNQLDATLFFIDNTKIKFAEKYNFLTFFFFLIQK